MENISTSKIKAVKTFTASVVRCLFVIQIFFMGYSATASAITFSSFVAGGDISATLGQHSTIGFSYAGNKFVGSVYFGPNNNQLYQTDLSGGSVTPFGAPIPGASGEIYVSSSLGLGGFASHDIFASQGSGVYQINNSGTNIGTFVSGLNGGVRGIAFDPYGVYGNDMLVTTTAGGVYRGIAPERLHSWRRSA